MWYSTKRKRENKGEKDPSASGVISPEADWKSSLPLDWTNMKTNCCKDPSTCKHRLRRRLNTLPNGNNKTTASNKIYGQAVFCLHDFDPKWLQGFFLQRGCKKPWGILAVQEEIDDCMACSAGGYRSLSLTVYHDRNSNSSSSSNYNSSSKTKSKCKSKIEGVDWTGGDMMTLYHPEYVNMTGERLLTVSIIPVMYIFAQLFVFATLYRFKE
jgi:hypothetical protein